MVTNAGAPEIRSPRTYGALAAMCLIWGSTFLAIRIGNEAVPPLWGAAVRLAIATPLYFIIARLLRASFQGGKALQAALGYGVLNYGANFALLYWGEERVSSGTAAVIYASVPLTTGLFAAWMGVHPFEARQLVGAVVGLLGVGVIFSGELTSGAPAIALAAVFGGSVAASLSGVVLKKGPSQSTWVVNAIGAAAGLPICIAASVVAGESHALPRGATGWGPILYLILAGNLGAYSLYGWLVTKWKVTNISVIALVIPVIAVALGALVRGETPPPTTYTGAALVLAGVALTLFTGEGRHEPARAVRKEL